VDIILAHLAVVVIATQILVVASVMDVQILFQMIAIAI
jgi:hypothetical protein